MRRSSVFETKSRDGIVDDAATSFGLSTILPDQVRQQITRPEQRLIAAVLEDAIRSALSNPTRGAEATRRDLLIRRDRDWIDSRDRNWPYTFENCCDMLGIDPDYVRRKVAERCRHAHHGHRGPSRMVRMGTVPRRNLLDAAVAAESAARRLRKMAAGEGTGADLCEAGYGLQDAVRQLEEGIAIAALPRAAHA